jgi:hypothetical protein
MAIIPLYAESNAPARATSTRGGTAGCACFHSVFFPAPEDAARSASIPPSVSERASDNDVAEGKMVRVNSCAVARKLCHSSESVSIVESHREIDLTVQRHCTRSTARPERPSDEEDEAAPLLRDSQNGHLEVVQALLAVGASEDQTSYVRL